MEGLLYCSANYVPLSPISFLERAVFVYGDKLSIIYGRIAYSWRETYERCLKLASALSQLGVKRGQVVAALAPNIPALYELQFGVPMVGAVLSALNTRLDGATLALILAQLEPKIIFIDCKFLEVVLEALEIFTHGKLVPPPLLVVIQDFEPNSIKKDLPHGCLDYNHLIDMGKSDFEIIRPSDECQPISINYTSGSTGNSKGVVYSHRAAFLNSLAEIFRFDMREKPVFLWTVDMFRCNGWCLAWAMAALGGTNICIRNVTATAIFDSINVHNVTHLCGPATILNIIADASSTIQTQKAIIVVAGALPSSQILDKVKELGFTIIHAYGMTEALGIVTVRRCDPKVDIIECREGVHNIMIEGIDVKDPTTMISVPADGKTHGRLMLRSNTLMMGYLKNPQKTQEAFREGWYQTKDLAVRHPNGYIEMKDREVDMISCGGESVSSIEIESVLISHPKVLEAAVVGTPYGDFGETPCAFLRLKDGCKETAEEIIKFCGDRLPQYATPQCIVFRDYLPTNSTGKIHKFVLREEAKAMGGAEAVG
ncbi:hypothetical protein NMG60_11026377 [Bertholletia excelsa]